MQPESKPSLEELLTADKERKEQLIRNFAIADGRAPMETITKRQWLAGQAMTGLIARTPMGDLDPDDIVSTAFNLAQMMLEENLRTLPDIAFPSL